MIEELKSIEAGAELLVKRSYKLRKLLEDGQETSSSSRKGKRLTSEEKEKLITGRRKRLLRK